MTAFSAKETHLKLRALLLAVSGIPSAIALENGATYTPTVGTPYLTESFVPSTNQLLTTTRGIDEHRGLYIVTWYGIVGAGIAAIRDGVAAILNTFPAGASFALTSGLTLRIRGDVGPYAGQITPIDAGFAVCVVTIPWRVYASQ